MTADNNGNYNATGQAADGSVLEDSGTVQLSSNGIITRDTEPTLRGVVSDDKKVAVVTDTPLDDPFGYSLRVFVKRGGDSGNCAMPWIPLLLLDE
jgi:hypothetical protein